MGPYVACNAVLVGVFAFGALHYALLWWHSRYERVLAVFALHCLLCSVLSCWLIVLAGAQSIATAQLALDARTTIALLAQATVIWVLRLVSGVRARALVATLTASCLGLAAINLWVLPLNGWVTALRLGRLPWGEEIVIARHLPVGWWLWLAYATVLAIEGFGLLVAARMGSRDRVAALLVAAATAGALAGALLGARVDLWRSPAPYLGALPYAVWVLLIGLLLSREYSLRGQKVAASERRFRAIFDSALDGIVTLDEAQRIVLFNPAAERIFGYAPAELVGQPHLLLIPERLRAAHEEHLRGFGRSGIPSQVTGTHVDLGGLRAGGVEFPMEASISQLLVDGRKYFTLICRDVTDRELAAATQKKLEAQLFQAQKMEAIGQLAGGVAHDFNNLLTVILGYCDLLLAEPATAESQAEMLHGIRYASERAAAVTRQLLAFSRKQVLEPRLLDLNEAVREAQGMLRRLIREDVRVVVDLAPQLGTIKADPGQIAQVILNLAVNARDAMPMGGTLTIETRNVEQLRDPSALVPARLEAGAGSFVLLAVTDTGAGMTAEVKARLFEPFFTTKESGEGTGLGMAVVHGIVEHCGGCLEVCSEPGAGTTMKVFLPVVAGRPETYAFHAGADAGRGSETLLLVEDDPALRQLTALALQKWGYVVLQAAGSREALQRMASAGHRVDLLVTDVVMPGMSGRTMVDTLRGEWPGLRTLFLSGYAADQVLCQGVLQAGEAFLQKPYSPAALAQRVREVLDAPTSGAVSPQS